MVQQDWEVLIVGGGIAGCAAACAAAERGSRTLLLERSGYLGGWSTAALVNPFMSSNTSDGKPLIGGFFSRLKARLQDMGGLLDNSFDPELMKLALQEMVVQSGAQLLLHALVTEAKAEENGIQLRIFSKSGDLNISGRIAVDCSGDGDVAIALGADYNSGDREGVSQAVTLMFDLGGVNLPAALEYVKANPDQMRFPKLTEDTNIGELTKHVVAVAGYYDKVSQAKAQGRYEVPGDLIFYISRPRNGEVTFNTTHVGEIDATNVYDLTRAEIEGRQQMLEVLKLVRSSVPGFENAYLVRSAEHVGVRESRRIIGKYIFDGEDVAHSRKFEDAICRLAYYVDIHKGKAAGYTRSEEKEKIVAPAPGDYYEIPYRCLVPEQVENVLVAGRCVSSTQTGHAAIRIMPCCAAMGEAAGTAAAMSASSGVPLADLNIAELKAALRARGALV